MEGVESEVVREGVESEVVSGKRWMMCEAGAGEGFQVEVF